MMKGPLVPARALLLATVLLLLPVLAISACGGANTTTATGSPTASPAASPSSGGGLVAPSEIPSPLPAATVAGTIAFTSDAPTGEENSNVSLVHTDGTDLRRVVKTRASEQGAAWSPDGLSIAYFENAMIGEFCTMDVVKADGSHLRKLPHGKEGGLYPAWSPDGKRLAYASMWFPTDTYPPARIYVCDADGSNRRQLTNGPDYDIFPAWTPDGQTILFLRKAGGYDRPGDVYSMRPDGSGLTRVTTMGSIMEFALSPDGTQLALSDFATRTIVLLPYGASGSPKTIVATDFNWAIVHMSWSPDGKALVLGNTDMDPSPEDMLVVVNADGSGLTVIPGVKGFQPAWRPE